jgi:hypothetical protein
MLQPSVIGSEVRVVTLLVEEVVGMRFSEAEDELVVPRGQDARLVANAALAEPLPPPLRPPSTDPPYRRRTAL